MQNINDSELTLILPRLLSQVKNSVSDDWKYLSMILARSQQHALAKSAHDYALALFGLTDANAAAALNLFHAGYSIENNFVCFAEPVNMQPNRDHLSIAKTDFTDLTQQEAQRFIDELNTYFEHDGFQFIALTPQHWFCVLSKEMSFPSVLATDIINQNILPHIPNWRENSGFKKFFSDVQMMLHHSKTNMLRNQQGKVEVNSLWLTRLGQLPQQLNTQFTHVLSDNNEVLALAQLAGINCQNVNEFSTLNTDSLNGNNLYYAAIDNYQALFDQGFFQQIFTAVKHNLLHEVTLLLDDEKLFSFNYASSKRFWKRKYRF